MNEETESSHHLNFENGGVGVFPLPSLTAAAVADIAVLDTLEMDVGATCADTAATNLNNQKTENEREEMYRRLNAMLIVSIAVLPICLTSSYEAQAQKMSIDEMAKLLPDSVNSVLVVNTERIRNSAIAKKEGWTDTYSGRISSGLVFFPEDANVVLLGAVMDYDTFHPRETAVLVSMNTIPSVAAIQQASNGFVDEINGTEVVATPNDQFIVPLDDHLIASFQPALRPNFGRWLMGLEKRKESQVNDYLKRGLSYADDAGTEIIAAFDMRNELSEASIYEGLKDNEMIREMSLDPRDAAGLIASLEGFTLGITVREKIYGSIKYDFNDDVSSLGALSKVLAIGICQRSGIHLDEFHEWNVETDKKQIKLSGEMSIESLRRILSIVDAPLPESMDIAAHEYSDSGSYSDPASRAKRYFDTINSLVDQASPKVSSANSYTENANWLRKYADKIDNMRVLNVDEELIAYGDYASQILRESSLLLIYARESSKQKNKDLLASGARSGGSYGYGSRYGNSGRFGSFGTDGGYNRGGGDGSRLRTATRYKEKSEAIKAIAQAFTEIAVEKNDVDQAMTSKYKIEF